MFGFNNERYKLVKHFLGKLIGFNKFKYPGRWKGWKWAVYIAIIWFLGIKK